MSKVEEMESGKKCIVDFSNEYIKRRKYIYIHGCVDHAELYMYVCIEEGWEMLCDDRQMDGRMNNYVSSLSYNGLSNLTATEFLLW